MTKQTIYLKDYRVPEFQIQHVDLKIELEEEYTTVTGTLKLTSIKGGIELQLDAQNLEIDTVMVDNCILDKEEYNYDGTKLQLLKIPEQPFELQTVSRIQPQNNTSLMGLYKSNGMFCSQCEAEGFRKITPFIDRPDVLCTFTTQIIGDKTSYPVLLSNGNPVESGEVGENKHYIIWNDPIPKPCYLFALVAGDLACIEDNFTTMSGRLVDIRFYVEAKDLDKCEHAISSLKRAMKWDEEVYGREYDLDIFMVVAVDDFNMGAMENKGLNIFNTSAVLANPEVTTDARFQWIEAVVAHEYFHNWTGNRVTCRDWFQLSLKEGFTVFRDSQFSADMNSPAVKRVEDIKMLINHQFAEDASPLAHPVQPDSYAEINNFYTLTVYEKGAEVVRMIQQILGGTLFRKGSDLYFDRHDGKAVTIEDFVKAMADVSNIDFSQFMNWYKIAGTPELKVSHQYHANDERLTLYFEQYNRFSERPYWIPVNLALITPDGNVGNQDRIDIINNTQVIEFKNIKQKPYISLLRGLSAPVKLETDFDNQHLLGLMQYDNDGYNQWNSSQTLAISWLKNAQNSIQNGEDVPIDYDYINALKTILTNDNMDMSMQALMLQLPTESYMADISEVIDTQTIHLARNAVRRCIAENLSELFRTIYVNKHISKPYRPDAKQIAQRSLVNICLSYWLASGDKKALEATKAQFDNADNMTNRSTALSLLVCSDGADIAGTVANQYAQEALKGFYRKLKHENLAITTWLSIQAQSAHDSTLNNVRKLLKHESFSITNPNKVRALIGSFAQNQYCFNHTSGSGYEFLTEQIVILNQINPQLASRLASAFSKWQRFPDAQKQLMKNQLIKIQQEDLSPDVAETISKLLGSG